MNRNGIKVEVVCQHKQTRYYQDEPCRIRLFRKRLRGESMPTFIMYWAVKEKDTPQVKKKTSMHEGARCEVLG